MVESSKYSNPECCCGSKIENSQNCIENQNKTIIPEESWIISKISTPIGDIPQVSTKLTKSDTLGTWKVRLGINRMNYKINPGIYCVGNPDANSHVLVTANYKLSFDMLRKELSGINAWILVLDTKGINVWCAAGKGTFGTEELVNRIAITNISKIVSHKTLILPQLGAPGVSAHEVQKRSGFKVLFGPVRASDIKAFIVNGMKATKEMRNVRFTTCDRVVLTPMELVSTFKVSMMVFGALFLINLIFPESFGIIDFYGYVGALLAGCFFVPLLLPWIPGKAFAWKGWLVGIIWAASINILNGWPLNPEYGLLRALAYMLILPSISAYYAMNFTGASTYTSLSGVLKEMKIAVPAIITSAVSGGILLLFSLLIPFM
jgi:hypothetical protein